MKKVLKWVGITLGSLVGLFLVTGVALLVVGNSRLNKTYDFPLLFRSYFPDIVSPDKFFPPVPSLSKGSKLLVMGDCFVYRQNWWHNWLILISTSGVTP